MSVLAEGGETLRTDYHTIFDFPVEYIVTTKHSLRRNFSPNKKGAAEKIPLQIRPSDKHDKSKH
ncbi:predicted protein [Sclerotinia sclerotiorum 1980 UF-70]|uniref:Uncharacterized protein n=1 Tax=Sclerotinia sclerotiorum (strain ATCC 18683 / 1980 / Ss-1) TaxID=665079 RepID=A7EYJ8_SCLS1|nr:predicted protein [Sclerotinia sclerotiorum 1980 UF-70]EDN94540.1 predicted protein [Sclerotinia sclerotiorum 1980 UF-70]